MRRARWLGRVRYQDAHALQRALMQAPSAGDPDEWLLLLEHPHVYTLGVSADLDHVLVSPASVGAELLSTDRGGDVTYHGPGQLVGYPIMSVPLGKSAIPCYVHSIEQLVIDALADVGSPGAARLPGYPGVWIEDRKICAIGVRVTRGRSMHGFALNLDPDMSMFGHIVPCGIADMAVTSLAAEGLTVTMREMADAIVARWGAEERQDVVWRDSPEDLSVFSRSGGAAVRMLGRLSAAGVRDGRAQARLAAGEGRHGSGVPRREENDAQPRPRDRVRGSGLSEHLRVLGRGHGHLHDQRRALHAGLRVLSGRHATPRGPGSTRARARG
jgi:lipoic acid synthetase